MYEKEGDIFIVERLLYMRVGEDEAAGLALLLYVQLLTQHLQTLRRVLVLVDVLHTTSCTSAAVTTSALFFTEQT